MDIPTHHFLSADSITNSESQDLKKTDSHLSNQHLRTRTKELLQKRRALQEKVGKAIDLFPPEPGQQQATKRPDPDRKRVK
jgi:hypothetical protein